MKFLIYLAAVASATKQSFISTDEVTLKETKENAAHGYGTRVIERRSNSRYGSEFDYTKTRTMMFFQLLWPLLSHIQERKAENGDGVEDGYTSDPIVLWFEDKDQSQPDFGVRLQYCESTSGFSACHGADPRSIETWPDRRSWFISRFVQERNSVPLGYFYFTQVAEWGPNGEPPGDNDKLVAMVVVESVPGENDILHAAGTDEEYGGHGLATLLSLGSIFWLKKTNQVGNQIRPIDVENYASRSGLAVYGHAALLHGFTSVRTASMGTMSLEELLEKPENYGNGEGHLTFYHEN